MIYRALERGRLYRIHQGIYSLVPFPARPTRARSTQPCWRAATALCSASFDGRGMGDPPFPEGDVDVTVVGKETAADDAASGPPNRAPRSPRQPPHQQLRITSPARACSKSPRRPPAARSSGRSTRRWSTTHHARPDQSHPSAYPHRPGPPISPHSSTPTVRPASPPRPLRAPLHAHPRADLPLPEVNARVGHSAAPTSSGANFKVILEIDGYQLAPHPRRIRTRPSTRRRAPTRRLPRHPRHPLANSSTTTGHPVHIAQPTLERRRPA